MSFYFLSIKFVCQRMGCEATEIVEVADEFTARSTVHALTPEGWGWDTPKAGSAEVLHCPEHRG